MEDVFARRKEKMQVEGMNHAELAAASESATDADEDEVADDRSGSGSSSDCYSSSSQMGVEKVAKTPAKKRAVAKKTPKASASTVRTRMRFKSHGEKRDPSPSHSDATSSRVAKNEKFSLLPPTSAMSFRGFPVLQFGKEISRLIAWTQSSKKL